MTRSAAAMTVAALDGAEAAAPDGSGPRILPRHIGIIMDGNGRWAAARGLPRREGHRQGVLALRRVVRACGERGIRHLTLFAFSSENWRRPAGEVRDLMGLLRLFIERDLAELRANGVRVHILGERENLQPDILALLERAEHVTREQDGQHLSIAFNYGGRDEIVRAARKLAEAVARGDLRPGDIGEAHLAAALDTAHAPDPDLIIRTSGEMRLSNFLLWQAAYAELVFEPCLWPDFDAEALDAALRTFAGRQRRFGGRPDADACLADLPKAAVG